MFPVQQNSRPQHSSQFPSNGIPPSAPLQQTMGNPGGFIMPNPMQAQAHMANNSNGPFAPGQLFPFQHMGNANSQQKGQILAQNGPFLNQNVGFGGLPTPMQNLNQLLQLQLAMQMASFAQGSGVPLFNPNQVMGLQNPNFAAMNAAQLGLVNANGTVQPQQSSMNGNLSKQMANVTQQLQGQSPLMNSFGIVQQQPQAQNFNGPGPANTKVPQGMGPQSSNFAMNAHLGQVNANGAVQQSKNGLSKQMPNETQQLQGQLPMMNPFGFVQQSQAQNLNVPAPANTQGMGPQFSNFAMNAHLGLLNANATVQQPMHGLFQQMPDVTQQFLGQLPLMNPFGFVQQPQTQNFNAPATANTQVNSGCVGFNNSEGNQKNSYNSNFSRNQKQGAKSMKSKFGKGKFSTHTKSLEKVHHKDGEDKIIQANSVKPEMKKKRSVVVTYSAEEIRRWREERRKNYPSKPNIEKKLTEKTAESEDSFSAAKLRRQQLKEILAKQVELGFEVAEIPSAYLSDSEIQVDRREQRRPLSRKGRFQKKFNKRERFNRNDRFSKKQRFGNAESPNTCDQKGSPAGQVMKSTREPTLLQKLLSSDIQRDKRRLLQVFRFMTINSFFKDWPEKPLKFPQVVLKETGNEIEAAEEIYDAIDTTIEKSSNESENNDEHENNISEFTEAVSELQENGDSESEETQEEGQITD